MDLDRGAGTVEVLDRRVAQAGAGVVEDQVALAERAALGVLAGEPNRHAVDQQRAEGERLGLGPVDAFAAGERLAAALELALQLGVELESLGDGEELLVDVAQALGRHGGVDRRARAAVELVLAGRLLGRAVLLLGLADPLLEVLMLTRHLVPGLLGPPVHLLAGDDAGVDQLLGVDLGDPLVLLDRLVHLGLGVGGLVGLVVAEAPVADQVDQHVVTELLAEGHRQAHGADTGVDVVGVDVDDRHVEALRQVGCPVGRTGVLGVGGEADLVVLDDVQRPADLVAVERLEVEGLGDDALADHRRVAVEDHRHRRP